MSKEELCKIKGGMQAISANLINSLVRMLEAAYDIGRAFGSAIRRATKRTNRC